MDNKTRTKVVQALLAAADRLDPHTLMGHVIDAKKAVFDDEKYAALNHMDKVASGLYAGRELLGKPALVRLDIPSAKRRGIVVVTIHEPSGTVSGYDHSAVVKGADFKIQPGAARSVGQGQRPSGDKQDKTPFSYVKGKLAGAGSQGAEASASGIPVYYDPQVVHLYVDARNGKPLKGAGEISFRYKSGGGYYLPEIDGIYIWAKSPVYYKPGEAPGATPGAYGGKWDWVKDTNLKVTGEPSKVVMP